MYKYLSLAYQNYPKQLSFRFTRPQSAQAHTADSILRFILSSRHGFEPLIKSTGNELHLAIVVSSFRNETIGRG